MVVLVVGAVPGMALDEARAQVTEGIAACLDHAAAANLLRTVLRHNPNDAEVWMNLGDVAIYQGDEVFARECYLRATQIDPGATHVITDARKRLSLMAKVSRSYRPPGP